MTLRFHHIGVACVDLESETRRFEALGYSQECPDFADPIQGVMGRFLTGGGPRMELLAPASGSGVLTPWLTAGVKLYHLGYETDDLSDTISKLKAERGRVVVQPVEAVAFGGRKIAFVLLPNLLLTELIASA